MSYYLKLYATSVVSGGVAIIPHTTDGAGWLPTLTADEADYTSTIEWEEETSQTISSTGFKYFKIDTAHIPLGSGTLQVKLVDATENAQNIKNVTFASNNHATAAWRPELVWLDDEIPLRALMGVGL